MSRSRRTLWVPPLLASDSISCSWQEQKYYLDNETHDWVHLELVSCLHFLLGGGDVRDGVCELDGLQLPGLGPGGHPRLGVVVIPGLVRRVPLGDPLPNLTLFNSSSLWLYVKYDHVLSDLEVSVLGI